MSGKRRATTDLNQDNWEREDEPESSGTFKKASLDEIKKRVFKIAKRRRPVSSSDETGDTSKTSAFASFIAFSKASASPKEAFSFLSNITTSKRSCEGTKNSDKSERTKFEKLDVEKNEITMGKSCENVFKLSSNIEDKSSKSDTNKTGSISDVSELSELSDLSDMSELPSLN